MATPPELKARIDDLLCSLAALSEAQAGKALDRRVSHARPESCPPPGFRERRRPDPDESLFDWFVWRLVDADDSMNLQLAAVVECEIRYLKRVRKPDELTPGAFGGQASVEDTKTRDKRIAEDYEGFTPEEVAIVERYLAGYVHPANVRKVRRLAQRDQESGMPNPDAAPGREAARVRELKHAQPYLSVREIAERVGISKSAAHRYLTPAA